MKSIVVIYHDDLDGFGAAWAAWKKFKNKAQYIVTDYHFAPLEDLKNKEIYIVDFCYEKNTVMKKLLKNNKRVIVIDHHISHKEAVKISSEYSFDLNQSGATLSWKYFHPQKPIPRLLRHIKDMDLWKFKIPHTKELLASLYTYDLEFSLWDKIAKDWEKFNTRQRYLKEGNAIIKYQNKIVKELAEDSEEVIFEGHKARVVNSPILQSQIGNYIVDHNKKIGIIWSYDKGWLIFSLRSDGKIDVSCLAKKFKGGGHKAASGFDLKSNIKFSWKKVK